MIFLSDSRDSSRALNWASGGGGGRRRIARLSWGTGNSGGAWAERRAEWVVEAGGAKVGLESLESNVEFGFDPA